MFDINFEQYKVFYYVAKNLSFSKASKELYISQSAVSQSIKNLESRIGVSLFLRQSKKIALTSEGELLYENVKIAFSYIANGELSVMENDNNLKKEIKLAASDTISKYFLLPYIEKFHRLYPDVKIKILNKPSHDCIELLKNVDVDMAIVNLSEDIEDKSIKGVKVKQIHDVFIAGPIYSYLKDKKLKLKDLENYPILALEKSASTRQNLDEIAKKYNVDIQPEIEMQSMGLLKDLTRIGLGLAYITDLAISKTTDLFVLDIEEKLSANFISVITLKRQKLNKYTQNFFEMITQAE